MSFLVEEGALTLATITGVFTTGLLNSFKTNIIDPSMEKLVPHHLLDSNQAKFGDMFPMPTGVPNPTPQIIKWQTFLKDFITWCFLILLMYLIWKYVLKPIRDKKINP